MKKTKHGKRKGRELIRCMKRGLFFGRMIGVVMVEPFELMQGAVTAADDERESSNAGKGAGNH